MMRRFLPARRPAALLALLAVVGAAACRELAFEPQDVQTVTFAPALNIALGQFTRLPSGTYYRDLAQGSGAPIESTSTITISYRGFLNTGQAFDTNYATTPSPPLLLAGFVPGFRAGMLGVRQGSRRQLIIPPDQGYGNTTHPSNRIPAGSVLVFDVNVTSVTTPVTPAPSSARTPR